MPSHRIPSPDLAAGTVGSHRGWVKLTLAGLCAAIVIGSLVAWRVSSAKKEDKKTNSAIILEFSPADLTTVEKRELSRTLSFSGSLLSDCGLPRGHVRGVLVDVPRVGSPGHRC